MPMLKMRSSQIADVSSWKKLDLPHDWSIYNDFDHDSPAQNEGGQLNGGDAWYRKTFKLDEEDLNKNVRITFDGVYMDSQVYVNGQLVGHYPNGYNQFSYDITDYLHKDGRENVVAVHAINKQPVAVGTQEAGFIVMLPFKSQIRSILRKMEQLS